MKREKCPKCGKKLKYESKVYGWEVNK